jgi:hypothetical protein
MLVCGAGCVSTPKGLDPKDGWKDLLSREVNLSQAIKDDYQDYIQKELIAKHYAVHDYNVWFYEDGTGQHAVKISLPINGTYREHVLVYDKDNKRIKLIRYNGGRYRS